MSDSPVITAVASPEGDSALVKINLNGQESAAIQVEIWNGKIQVMYWEPQKDYSSTAAVLLASFPVAQLSESLFASEPDEE